MAVRREYIESLYRDVLGRGDNYTPQEVEGWMNAPDEQSVYNMFISSPEYTSRTGGQAGWHNDASGAIVQGAPDDSSSKMPVDGSGSGSGSGYTPAPSAPAPYTSAPPSGGNLGYLSGFSHDNYNDPAMQSMKYQFARIASKYDPTQPGALDRLVADPEFRQAFPNARIVGKDSIDFGGQLSDGSRGLPVGVVDVGQMFYDNRAGKSWQWLDQGNMGGGTGTGAGSSGTARTGQNIANLYSQLGQMYGGPGGPGVNNGPLQQVGQDPLSQLITGGLANLILNEGMTSNGQNIMSRLQSIIESGGQLPGDGDQRMRRFESARELMAKGERTALNDARASLADRGLLSEPGNESGAEMSTIGRVQTRNAEEFARALRDIGIEEDDRQESRLTAALGLATGMASDQARMLLSTLGAGTDRQNALAQIALEQLSQNMSWNMFLAQFGLERDKALYQIQSGNIDALLPYMSLFLQLAQSTSRGYI